MRLLQAMLLALVLVPLPASARHAHKRAPRPDAAASQTATKPAFPGGVSASFDIPYAALPGLTLDIYVPPARPAPVPMPKPIIVFVHGGSWKNGDSRHNPAFADFPRALAGLAAQGYVVASVNYRLSPQVHFPAALQDVKAAIRWLRGHAGDYGGDMTRVAVWGASAGGHLAAMAGTTCGVMQFEPEGAIPRDAPSDCAEAVIDWFGPTDLAAVPPGDAGNYLDCEPAACAPGVVRQASPLSYIAVTTPPFLIQQGATDTEVAPTQSQALYDALRKKGVPAEIEIYPDVGHGFMRGNTPDAATVTRAMGKLTAFLAATFPPAPPPKPKAKPAMRKKR
jgi:acetyl esterase/lipase